MDIYTTNGNIIRQFPKNDGTTEIELEFLFDDLFWTRLFSIAIFYVAFFENLKINYVQSKHTYTRAVIKQADLSEDVKQELIRVTLEVKENSIMLRALADKLLFNQAAIKDVETNFDEDLSPFKVVDVRGKNFLTEFSEALKKRTNNPKILS